MESAATRPTRRFALWPLPAMLAFAWLPFAGHAADAHRAVQAKPGDMVLLRNVSTRPAVRPAPPGMALMASPSPRPEVLAALDATELSDADFAQLGASPSPTAQLPAGAIGHSLDGVLVHGSGSGSFGSVAGNGVSNTLAAPMGAVGNATRGIGDQVQGALAQLPFGNGH